MIHCELSEGEAQGEWDAEVGTMCGCQTEKGLDILGELIMAFGEMGRSQNPMSASESRNGIDNFHRQHSIIYKSFPQLAFTISWHRKKAGQDFPALLCR